MQVLGIHVESAEVKAAVVDAAAAEPAGPAGPIARVRFDVRQPTAEAAEVLPEELWAAVTAASRQACRDFPNVAGLGLTTEAPWLVLLDKADQPLGPIWTHLDRRSRPAARQVWAAVGTELQQTAGNPPVPGSMTAVVYRQQLSDDPYLCHRVRSLVHLNGWLALYISGERAFDWGNASLTGLFGTLTDRQWSPKWCDYFEVDRSWLPAQRCGSTTLGTVRAAAAAELGVTAGIPLKLGTLGIASAILAAGLTGADLLHQDGPFQVLAVQTSEVLKTSELFLLSQLVGLGGTGVQVAFNPVGGVAIEWLRQLCFRDQSEVEFYERTLPAASQLTVREVFDPPYLGGDPLEIEAHREAFRDLTLATDRVNLLAAMVQAMRRGHRQALAALGVAESVKRVVMSGSRSEMVRGLLPEYAGLGIETQDEGPLHGVAKLFCL